MYYEPMTNTSKTAPFLEPSSDLLSLSSEDKIRALKQEVSQLRRLYKEEQESLQKEKKEHEKTKEFAKHYKIQNDLLKQHIFAKKKSESILNAGYKVSGPLGDQLVFAFDEVHQDEDGDSEASQEDVEVKPYKRKKNGHRKKLPEDLKRVTHIHDLSPEQKICGACQKEKQKIDELVSERIVYHPATLHVEQNVRFKYACRCCDEGTIETAPLPFNELIPKSWVTPSLLASVLISKYCHHIPLYRQSQIWNHIHVDLSRSVLSKWVLKAGDLLRPIVEHMQKQIKKGQYIQIDETPVKVLSEQGAKKYMWSLVGRDSDGHLLNLFRYGPGRGSDVAKDLLKGFKGYVQKDAYKAYDFIEDEPTMIPMGCMAHVRRKFFEIASLSKKKKTKAHEALEMVAKLYRLEKEIKEEHLRKKQKRRQKEALPILETFKKWLEDLSPKVPPQAPLGKAITYALKQWDQLLVYIRNGRLEIDNNRCERSIKPFAVGRKNWLFLGNEKGANAAANIYSLIETCKSNKINPYEYLLKVFESLEKRNEIDYSTLTPMALKPSLLE